MSSLPPQDLGELDLRKAIDNFIEAPLEEIIQKFEGSGVIDKVGFMDLGDKKVTCDADQGVLGGGAQENVGRGDWLVQEDCRYRSQDQKCLENDSIWKSTRKYKTDRRLRIGKETLNRKVINRLIQLQDQSYTVKFNSVEKRNQ